MEESGGGGGTGPGTPRRSGSAGSGPPAASTALARLLVTLAGRSLPLGARIYWLLSAAAVDGGGGGGESGAGSAPPPSPGTAAVAAAAASLRDACERAALEGSWEPPFEVGGGGGGLASPLGSPTGGGWGGGGGGGRRQTSPLSGAGRRALSPAPPGSPALSPTGSDAAAAEAAADGGAPPFGGRGRTVVSAGSFASAAAAAGAAAGLEGLFCSSPPPAAAPSPIALAATVDAGVARASGRAIPGAFAPRPPRLSIPHTRTHPHPPALARLSAQLAPPTSPSTLRASTFSATLDFVEALTDAAAGLAAFAPPDRAAALARGLAELDREVAAAAAARAPVWWPLPRPVGFRGGEGGGAAPPASPPERVVAVVADRAALLNSRDKAPFLVWLEVVAVEAAGGERGGGGEGGRGGGGAPPPTSAADVSGLASAFAGLPLPGAPAPAPPISHARVPSDEALAAVAAAARAAAAGEAGAPGALAAALAAATGPAPTGGARPTTPPTPQPSTAPLAAAAAAAPSPQTTAAHRALYGPPAAAVATSLRSASRHGRSPGWAARPVIVKAGDDGRQEALAAGLLAALDAAWRAAGLPLRLTPYAVLPAGPAATLVEAVPDATSLHALKRELAAQAAATGAPPLPLAAHFAAAHPPGTEEGQAALTAYVSSLAAYSVASHVLSLKDRHNGNILLTSGGALVHVDFGFMLGASPGGNLGFESAPFKLSRELMEVMKVGGEASAPSSTSSPAFDAFRLLFVRGLLALRPLAETLATLVEAAGAGPGGASLPCFRAVGGGARAAAGLRARLLPGLPDGKAVRAALALIDASADAWRTRQYDYYQRVLNGIL